MRHLTGLVGGEMGRWLCVYWSRQGRLPGGGDILLVEFIMI